MSQAETTRRIGAAREKVALLVEQLGRSFLGHREIVEFLALAVLCDGHVLLEGAPGLGKTTLVRALASALELDFQRIQCTPDLMPGDVLGTRILEEQDGTKRFVRVPGPVFTHLLLADEINRATPRTQSALLEAMAERQVTLYGERIELERPFLVIATQNPIEMEGTYPLPEAQLDRFLVELQLGAPSEEDILRVLVSTTGGDGDRTGRAMTRVELLDIQDLVRAVPAPESVLRFAARTVLATHPQREDSPAAVRQGLRYGASPRGAQALVLLAKARALVGGRLHASVDDVAAVAAPALRHRLVRSYEGEAQGLLPDTLVEMAIAAARPH